jgi:hypothetical protein
MPLWFQRIMLRIIVRITIGPYKNYGMREPDHKIFEQHPTINTDLLNYVKLGKCGETHRKTKEIIGKIHPHPDIRRFHGSDIEFEDGTKKKIDIVVFATGYNMGLPMLSPGIVEYKDGIPQLVGGLMHNKYK